MDADTARGPHAGPHYAGPARPEQRYATPSARHDGRPTPGDSDR